MAPNSLPQLLHAVADLAAGVHPRHVPAIDHLHVGKAVVREDAACDGSLPPEATRNDDHLVLGPSQLGVAKFRALRDLHLALHRDVSVELEVLASKEHEVRQGHAYGPLDAFSSVTGVADVDDERLVKLDELLRFLWADDVDRFALGGPDALN